MAEHEADREPEETPPGEPGKGLEAPLGDGGIGKGAHRDDQAPAFDEEAAWAAIVAGYGEEPPDPPGAKPFKSVEDLALLERATNGDPGHDDLKNRTVGGGDDGEEGRPDDLTDDGTDRKDGRSDDRSDDRKDDPKDPSAPADPLGSSVSFAPGVGTGPRDYAAPEPAEDDYDEDDEDGEGHFVPPEPPPLPAADTTAKFAWLAVLGGPVLLLLAVVFGWTMTWWLATVGVGGFLGGFATLVMRMKSDDDGDDDPGRGAVV